MILQLQIVLAKLSITLIALAMTTSTLSNNLIQENAINGAGLEKQAIMSGGTKNKGSFATEAILGQKEVSDKKIDLPNDLKRACSCESWGTPEKEPRQFNFDGSILWGNHPTIREATTTDTGSCQISLTYWKEETKKLGLDVINSQQDNFKFALWLYDKFGMKPWKASKNCWNEK